MSSFPKYFFSSRCNLKLGILKSAKLFGLLFIFFGGVVDVSNSVKFSQFHLPPCCYLPSGPHLEDYGGPHAASAPSEQNATYTTADSPYTRSIGSGEEFGGEGNRNKVYKLIVPLKFPSTKGANAALHLERPPRQPSRARSRPPEISVAVTEASPVTSLEDKVTPSTLVSNSAEKDTVNDAGSDVFNVFLLRELAARKNKGKGFQRGQEQYDHPQVAPTPPPPPPPAKEESMFERIAKLGFNFSNRLQQLSDQLHSMSETVTMPDSFQNSHGPYQMYRKFVKRQATYDEPQEKMPSVWIKNLRKALYQSLSSRSKESSNSPSQSSELGFKKEPPSSGLDMDRKLLWKHLRSAKLKFIDLTSHSSSDLPEEIYLPAGKGPIVSGIATLAASSGNLEIRIPSELYIPKDNQGSGSGEGVSEHCKCNLIRDGDMVLAYWSISRIVAEDGQPALQYLVFPHPHPYHTGGPPTPPQLLPFNTGEPYDFNPSPPDPVPNYLNEISNQKGPPHQQYHRQKFPGVSDARHRTPKFHDDFYTGVGNPLQPHLPIPHDPRGVPIDYNGKYTDDFLSMYKAAINHHFHSIDSVNPGVHGDEGIPEDYVHNHYPPNIHPIPESPGGGPPHIPHEPQPGIPYDFPEPITVPGIATPINSNYPQNSLPPNDRDPDHPRSIQDIISPFVPPPPPPHAAPPQGSYIPQQYPYDQTQFYGNDVGVNNPYFDNRQFTQFNNGNQIPPYQDKNPNTYSTIRQNEYSNNGPSKRPRPTIYHDNDPPQFDKRYQNRDRDYPRKQSQVKDYFTNNYKASGVKNTFVHKVGPSGGVLSNGKVGGTLNDIDNPDGYILDFKK